MEGRGGAWWDGGAAVAVPLSSGWQDKGGPHLTPWGSPCPSAVASLIWSQRLPWVMGIGRDPCLHPTCCAPGMQADLQRASLVAPLPSPRGRIPGRPTSEPPPLMCPWGCVSSGVSVGPQSPRGPCSGPVSSALSKPPPSFSWVLHRERCSRGLGGGLESDDSGSSWVSAPAPQGPHGMGVATYSIGTDAQSWLGVGVAPVPPMPLTGGWRAPSAPQVLPGRSPPGPDHAPAGRHPAHGRGAAHTVSSASGARSQGSACDPSLSTSGSHRARLVIVVVRASPLGLSFLLSEGVREALPFGDPRASWSPPVSPVDSKLPRALGKAPLGTAPGGWEWARAGRVLGRAAGCRG